MVIIHKLLLLQLLYYFHSFLIHFILHFLHLFHCNYEFIHLYHLILQYHHQNYFITFLRQFILIILITLLIDYCFLIILYNQIQLFFFQLYIILILQINQHLLLYRSIQKHNLDIYECIL